MIGRLPTLILGLTALTAACAAPSSYDGLTGGAKEDASLVAPRPMSPLSVTMVATSRPRMKWELFDKETGAIVELCKTRDFAAGTVKSFEADGRELVVPEDLEAGIWFWRLKARTDSAHGTLTSPTWEVLVRGPAAHGSSDVPTGAIVDLDGDGHPDLITAGDEQPIQGDPFPYPDLLAFLGAPDGTITTDSPQLRGFAGEIRESGFVSVAAGIDFDGDGFTDMAYSGLSAYNGGGGTAMNDVAVELGGKYDPSSGAPIAFPMLPILFGFPGTAASLSEAGDVNGDGYGDLLAGDPSSVLTVYGGRKGPTANVLVSSLPVMSAGVPSRVVHGALDLNADGLSDILVGPVADAPAGGTVRQLDPNQVPANPMQANPNLPQTAMFALGSDGLDVEQPKELSIASVADVRARAFTSGDFDGDGLNDIASTVPVDGNPRVCVWFGDRDKGVVPGPCTAGLDGDADLGASLTAGDLEGDGKDEILATVRHGGASEVRVLHVGEASVDIAPIGQSGFGQHLTTVWPGRPGKARWAAIADDGQSIGVFEGGRLAQSLAKPRMIKENFGRALR
jgi:hypothetical protein